MKMETPKMDVVRFQEADVIVASSPVFATKVGGFNNEALGDGNITYKDVTYYDAASLNAALAEDHLRPYYQLYIPEMETQSQYHTSDMFYIDSTGESGYEHSILIPDGTYVYNGDCFVKVQ